MRNVSSMNSPMTEKKFCLIRKTQKNIEGLNPVKLVPIYIFLNKYQC